MTAMSTEAVTDGKLRSTFYATLKKCLLSLFQLGEASQAATSRSPYLTFAEFDCDTAGSRKKKRTQTPTDKRPSYLRVTLSAR
ncbi:hypothetical protein BaRGS_00029525 [Batillaria attramentaria]|uniref:Uncharacterized protein n=1 Tax=Batillaria attramentaria TaxID=370345 RepID=A0ABD0JVU1_9CAEN